MARAPRLEEQPSHDAMEGVASPRETSILFGHAAAERTLLDSYRSGRMPHGWVFAGDRGIGKSTLAFRLARFVLAHPDPADAAVAAAADLGVPIDHPAARRVASGTHPNLLHLQREWMEREKRHRTELSVDTVRRINPFLGSTAGEEGWRIVIVDPADDMNRSAANAILKNLEEPPRRTMFILLARSRGALLPTILSRCRTLDLGPLTPEETAQAARAAAPGLPEGDDPLATALADGSPRRLIELRQGQGSEIYRLMLSAVERGDREAQLSLSGRMADSAALERLLEFFEGYLRRRIHGAPEPAKESSPPAAPLVTWAELWEKATLSGREVETYNLDRRQFVLDLLESSAAALR